MTKNDFQEVVKALRNLADALEALPPAKGGVPEEEKPKEPKPALKLEDVRAVLSDISRQGKTKEMRELLRKFGATKLSEIDSARYGDLLTEAEVIRNA